MVRNKLAEKVRREYRGGGCRGGNAEELLAGQAGGAPPYWVVEGKELVRKVRRALTEEERQLLDPRLEGLTWPEVAARVGGS
jgi:hypothetical protein